MSIDKQNFSVSVIICHHEDYENLSKCLDAIENLRINLEEVIIVDDGSEKQDYIRAITESKDFTFYGLNENCGPAYARNFGAEKSQSDILLFVDSDVVLNQPAVTALLNEFSQHQDIDAAFGSYKISAGHNGLTSQYVNARHHYYHQLAHKEAQTFWSGFGAIKRNIFNEMKGFPISRSRFDVEDIALGVELKNKSKTIHLVKVAQVEHLKQWSLVLLIKTDIFMRAIPWSLIIHKNQNVPNTLNTSHKERGIALVCILALIALFLCIFVNTQLIYFFVSMILVFTILNINLSILFLKVGGIPLLLYGTILHYLYYVYSSCAFILVALYCRLTKAHLKS